MQAVDFNFISQLIRERCGITLNESKTYLLESRLLPIARKNGHENLDGLIGTLRHQQNMAVVNELVEAMTTNETSFFRDIKPFEMFEKVALPHLLAAPHPERRLRIWSAACSTGQEPYSLSILLKEQVSKLGGLDYEILGTDLSEKVIAKARAAAYSQFEVQRGLPVQKLVQCFTQEGELWHLRDEFKKNVTFQTFNLLSEPKFGEFDVIFCRNVLIYFDEPTRKAVVERLVKYLKPHGLFFVGSTESLMGMSDQLRLFKGEHSIYERMDASS